VRLRLLDGAGAGVSEVLCLEATRVEIEQRVNHAPIV
jgi:hypothetical protein